MWQWMCGFPVLETSNWLKTALFWVITHSIFRGHGFLTPLMMGPIFCPETSVRNYHYSLLNNPEERSSHLLCGGSLKSRLTGCYEVWKGNNFTVCLLRIIYFQPHRKRLFDLDYEGTTLLQNVAFFWPNVTEGLIHNFAESLAQQRYFTLSWDGFLVPCLYQSLCLVSQRYPHHQNSTSAQETDESRDLRLPPRYEPDLPSCGDFYAA